MALDDAREDPAPRLPARRERRKRSKWPARLVVVGLIAAAFVAAPRLFKRPPISVEAVRVERAAVRDEVSSSAAGEVVPARRAIVRSELGARVVAVRHRRGERVRRGEAIVLLDVADLDARLAQARAALDAQRAQVAQAAARADAAKKAAGRTRALADRGAASAQAVDDAASADSEADAAAQAARGLLAQAEAALKVAAVARGKAELAAPFDGLLVDVPPEVGDELQPGSAAFEIVDDSRLHVEATIDEADLGRVRVGQPAVLRLDALPGKPLPGAVTSLGPTVRRDEKGARTVRIDVDVTDLAAATAAGLRPGMSANVDVRVAEKPDVPSLPTNVIVGRGTRRSVYRVENGVAHLRPIEVGLSSWERSEIVSGLAVGDLVVATLNAKDLADGVPVAVGATH